MSHNTGGIHAQSKVITLIYKLPLLQSISHRKSLLIKTFAVIAFKHQVADACYFSAERRER